MSTWYIAQYQLGKNEGLRLKFCGLVQYRLPAQTTSAWNLRSRRKTVVKFEKVDFVSQTIYQTIEANYWNFLWHAFVLCFETLHILEKFLLHQFAIYKKWLIGNFLNAVNKYVLYAGFSCFFKCLWGQHLPRSSARFQSFFRCFYSMIFMYLVKWGGRFFCLR